MIAQTGNAAVADKGWTEFCIVARRGRRGFEIEDADAEALFAFISPAVTRTSHNAFVASFFSAEVNHGVRDWRIAFDGVSAGPKQQVARLERIEFKGIRIAAENRLKFSGLAQPDILLAGIARDIVNAVLLEHIINEPRTIHPAVARIRRAVRVTEIAFGQIECAFDKLADLGRIIFVISQLVRRDGRDRCSFSLWFGRSAWTF